MQEQNHEIAIPVGMLSLIGMKGCEEITSKVDHYLVNWRSQRHGELMDDADFIGYCRDTYQLRAECPRFGTGEAKGTLNESVRLRTAKNINAAEICKRFGGGGHMRAAGCFISGSLEEVIEEISNAAIEALKEYTALKNKKAKSQF